MTQRARQETFLCTPRYAIILFDNSFVLMQRDKMIIATIRDEGQIGGKGKGKQAVYDSDTDTDGDDDVVEVKDENVGWAYIGSHNFTPSAWGNLSGSSFNPVLNVCGPFPPRLNYACHLANASLLCRSQITSWALCFR